MRCILLFNVLSMGYFVNTLFIENILQHMVSKSLYLKISSMSKNESLMLRVIVEIGLCYTRCEVYSKMKNKFSLFSIVCSVFTVLCLCI